MPCVNPVAGILPATPVRFVSVRGRTLLLAVGTDPVPATFLAIAFPTEAAAGVGVGLVFETGETFGEIMQALPTDLALDLDLDAVGCTVPRPVATRPVAVIAHGEARLLPEKVLDRVEECLQGRKGRAEPSTASSPMDVPSVPPERPGTVAPPPEAVVATGPPPKVFPVPEAHLPAGLEFTLLRDERVQVRRHSGDGKVDGITLSLSEIPFVIRSLSGMMPQTGRTTVDRAARVMLARLYASYPGGLTAAELDALVVETGLDVSLSEMARGELRRDGLVALHAGVYRIKG